MTGSGTYIVFVNSDGDECYRIMPSSKPGHLIVCWEDAYGDIGVRYITVDEAFADYPLLREHVEIKIDDYGQKHIAIVS